MKVQPILDLSLSTGGTVNVPVEMYASLGSFNGSYARVSGTATLASSFNVSPSGTPEKNTVIFVSWEANATLSGNSVSIFGQTIPDELASKNYVARCVYNGASWIVNVLVDWAETDTVRTSQIVDDAITLSKMASGTTGSILAYNASGDIEEVDMATDGKLLIGVTAGKGYNAAVLSGDATISTGGVLSLANGSVDTDELVASSVTTGKIKDAAVTAEKLSDGARKDSFSIRLDFDDASKLGGQIFLPVCYNCTVDSVKATLVGAAGSDLTTIIKDAGGTVMTGSQIDIPSATVIGNVISSTVTGNNTMTAGTNIILEPSAAGALGGYVHFTFCVTRNN